jgi:TPR repeat protein
MAEVWDDILAIRKALQLVEASACQGYIPAQNNLGSFYTENDGEAPVDYKKPMHGIILLLLMVR